MICAVLQARFSSRRLPGKVLLPILGKPMLAFEVERVMRSRTIDRLVIATSDREDDDGIARLAGELGVGCHRGSLDDVLDRFHGAVRDLAPQHVVRLTGDCPLADPAIIDRVVQTHLDSGDDYTSNTLERTYADGLDVEIMTRRALDEAAREARLPSEREHVTPFIYRHPDRYRIGQVTSDVDMTGQHWTVDTPEDFELIRRILEALYPDRPEFDSQDVLDLMRAHPEWQRVNEDVDRREGWRKSMEQDRRFLDGDET